MMDSDSNTNITGLAAASSSPSQLSSSNQLDLVALPNTSATAVQPRSRTSTPKPSCSAASTNGASTTHHAASNFVVLVPPSNTSGTHTNTTASATVSPPPSQSAAAATNLTDGPSRPRTPLPPLQTLPPQAPLASAGSKTKRQNSSVAVNANTGGSSNPALSRERSAAATATIAVSPFSEGTHAGALRFTCTRCRRSFVVQPDQHCSASKKRTSVSLENANGRLNKLSAASTQENADEQTCAMSRAHLEGNDFAPTVQSTSTSCFSPELQATVAGSFKTCGTGQRYRPLFPPMLAVTESDTSNKREEEQLLMLARQRALLDALPSDVFTSAEVLSDTELADLLTYTQLHMRQKTPLATARLPFAVANPDSIFDAVAELVDAAALGAAGGERDEDGRWVERVNGQLRSTNAQHSAAGAASTHAASDEAGMAPGGMLGNTTVLGLEELARLGVPVRAAAENQQDEQNADAYGAESKMQHSSLNSEGDEEGAQHLHHPCIRQEDGTSSRSSSRSLPDLMAVETRVMASNSSDLDKENPTVVATPHRCPPTQELRGFTRVNTCCYEESPESCPLRKKTRASDVEGYTDTTTTISNRGITLPFDELCRRWMRLVVHAPAAASAPSSFSTSSSSPLPTQPLCLECWTEGCLTPLQQRTKNALEGVDTFTAVFHNHAAEERDRLWTLICEVPSSGSGGGGDDGPDRYESENARHATESIAQVTTLSLDAVAANVFGARESEWLTVMSGLSTSHGNQMTTRPQKGVNVTENASLVLNAPRQRQEPHYSSQTTQRKATRDHGQLSNQQEQSANFSFTSSEAFLEQHYAELHELESALRDVQLQQAALDAQKKELMDVMQALNTTSGYVEASESSNLPSSNDKIAPGVQSTAGETWSTLAATHNIHEVQAAFTSRDETAERRHTTHDLHTRHAFLQTTSVDALCFPIDVSGPIGMIAGLRLGLVPPYTGSGAEPGSSQSAEPLAHRSSHQTLSKATSMTVNSSRKSPQPDAACAASTAEESMYLEGFVRRQVQYAQLLLSGNTAAAASVVNATETRAMDGRSSPFSHNTANNVKSNNNNHGALSNVRVALPEVNAACGYLLLLLNYLAQVNGFAFQTALLRPAGDRSTVALLKRVSRSSANPPAATRPSAAATATSGVASSFPFSFFGLFTNPPAAATDEAATTAASAAGVAMPHPLTSKTRNSTTSAAAPAAAAPSAWSWSSAPRSSYTVDHEVDFYITDRVFAWRTFGAGCVAVASCVRELSDALHESLRCWRLREGMVRRHPHGEEISCESFTEDERGDHPRSASRGAQERSANAGTEQIRKEQQEQPHTQIVLSREATAPTSLPHFMHTLIDASHGVSSTASTQQGCDTAQTTSHPESSAEEDRRRGFSVTAVPMASMSTLSQFPLHPPYRIQNDTVDGFSVRHGAVSEAIWTLGMKKLLADVQWCMGATVELERLYAITGEGDGSDVEEV